jgi:hypothetical protein
LSQPPHSKLYWQGTPGAYGDRNDPDGGKVKGDLCDPCHCDWEKEQKWVKLPVGDGSFVLVALDDTDRG